MAEIPAYLMPHTVSVEPLEGAGAYGDRFTAQVDNIACMRDDKVRMVRNSDGDQVTSQTTLYMRLVQEPRFPAGSRVHLPTRVATVIGYARREDGGKLGAWQHLEVTLT